MRTSFVVVGVPKAKQRPRTFEDERTGKPMTITPRATRDYERDVAYEAKKARVKVSGLAVVRFRFYGARGDVDNLVKSCLDGMNKVVYDDDRQVEELHAYLHRDANVPRAEICVGPKGSIFGDEVRAAAAELERTFPTLVVESWERIAAAVLTAARCAGSGERA